MLASSHNKMACTNNISKRPFHDDIAISIVSAWRRTKFSVFVCRSQDKSDRLIQARFFIYVHTHTKIVTRLQWHLGHVQYGEYRDDAPGHYVIL